MHLDAVSKPTESIYRPDSIAYRRVLRGAVGFTKDKVRILHVGIVHDFEQIEAMTARRMEHGSTTAGIALYARAHLRLHRISAEGTGGAPVFGRQVGEENAAEPFQILHGDLGKPEGANRMQVGVIIPVHLF